MNYVGVDLHKRTISICVMVQENGRRTVIERKRMSCSDASAIESYISELKPFRLVMEATSSYEWFWNLVEPSADRVVLAHPKKMRVIAESTRKSDKLDAQFLAEFLALDMIPEAHRPSPRTREHRRLVRFRYSIVRRLTSIKTRLRWLLTSYNADIKSLFSKDGLKYLNSLDLSPADRFYADSLVRELDFQKASLALAERKLLEFGESAPAAEREARAVLETIPYVGPVTIDVVVSELGDVRRYDASHHGPGCEVLD